MDEYKDLYSRTKKGKIEGRKRRGRKLDVGRLGELSLSSPINPEYPYGPPLLNWVQLTGLVQAVADVVRDSFADHCVLGTAGLGGIVKL